jgi:hypothetical protein
VQSNYRVRSRAETGVLHAISTPRIEALFMACNMPLQTETWRAFRIARHDNTP